MLRGKHFSFMLLYSGRSESRWAQQELYRMFGWGRSSAHLILDKTYTFAEKKKTFVQLTPCFLCLWMCQSMCRSQHFQRKQLLRCGSRARLWLVVIMICEWRFCVFNLHQNSNLKIPMFVLSPTFEQDPSQENPVWCSQNDAFDILNFVIFRRRSAEMWSNCCDWRLNSEMSEHRGSQR